MAQLSRWWLVGAACMAAVACSDDDEKKTAERPAYLGRTPAAIAADALSDAPSAEYLAVRGRVVANVPKDRRVYARNFALAAGRGPALVGDPTISTARSETAIALGVSLDPAKVGDSNLANASLDALLGEVHKRLAGAPNCEALGAKADDCAVALLLLEVQRSEAVAPMDGGVVLSDGAVSDGAVGDGAVADASRGSSDAAVLPPGPLTTFECGSDVSGAREVSGSISAPETWSGKVLVKNTVYMQSALTIEPGTQIFMNVDTALYVGWSNTAATIVANGTPEQPIRFCGVNAEAGYWGALQVEANVTSDSVLRNVLIAGGGGDQKAALVLNADLTVDNVQVRNVSTLGVQAVDFKEGSRQLSVEGSAGAAVALTGIGAITRFPLGGYFRGNIDNVARLRLSRVDATTVVHNLGIPYVQEQTLYTGEGDLTIEAGVDYRFQPDTSLEVGWSNASAGFYVQGTAAAPVVFRGVSDVSASWGGISINANVKTNSHLTYTEIRQGGRGTTYALSVLAPVKVDHVTLTGNGQGVLVAANGFAAESNALTITGGQSYPLVARDEGWFGLPKGGTLTGNAIDQISVEASTLDRSGTIHDLGVPYLIVNSLYLSGTTTFTVAPGVEFLLGADVNINVGWSNSNVTLIADGTADAPIRFTGLNAVAGSWGTIAFERSVSSASKLNYLQIGHGGKNQGSLLSLRASIPVTNSRFFDSGGFGIAKLEANTIDYLPSNTFENVPSGNVKVE